MTPSPPDTRASLIVRLPDAADVEAWDEFVVLYGPIVYRLGRKRGLQAADADDLVQEVFANVVKSVSQWLERSDRGSFRAWLCTIARNVAINLLTRPATRKLSPGGDAQQQLARLPETADDWSRQFQLEYRREVFQHAAAAVRDTVAPDTWQAFWLTQVEGLSIEEAARRLDTDVGNIYIARSRVMARSLARHLLAPPTHPEMLGRLGRYEVERLIGSGGMGVVFKAFDTELNRPVAIKVLAPYLSGSGAARTRFAREARAAAAIVHEHVVAIHNVETAGESPFLVMQYVAGESLQARLDREGPLKLCEILRIATQTAAGLAAAHAQGLVHRDVKPSNILLERGIDRTLLTDFGLARASDDASLTYTGHHPGTPQYMSPEQVRGEAIDGRSDLFSLGSVMYAMCTGRSPFRAESNYAVLRRITDARPLPVRELNPEIPAWLEWLIGKLHAKSVAQRFASATEVHALLEQCLAHVQQPTAARLPEVLRAAARSVERKQRLRQALSGGWSLLRMRPWRATTGLLAASLLLAVGLELSHVTNWSRREPAGSAQVEPPLNAPSLPTEMSPSSTAESSPLERTWNWHEPAPAIDALHHDLPEFETRAQLLWDELSRAIQEPAP